MKISLTPAGGSKFEFSLLPEKVQARYAAKYQNFDIISEGSVSVPRGTDVAEVSWDGEFPGSQKMRLAGVKKEFWQEPDTCVRILNDWMENGTELTLIISRTWINMDVTIASFEASPHGAYGDISYSISFKRVKHLKIYTMKESKVGKKKKTKPRAKKKKKGKKLSNVYVVKRGETIARIAMIKGMSWTDIYDMNKKVIEQAAARHGYKTSDLGKRLFPGTQLTIP